MKKKVAARLNRSAAKHKKNKPVASQKSGGSKPLAAPPKRPSLMDDPRFAQAVQNYEAGLKAMQGRKFERAKGFRARNEPDFQNLADDPRFTELLYPEGDTGASPEAVVTAKTPKRR